MELITLDPELPKSREVAGAVALLNAARIADQPYRIALTLSSFAARLKYGWDGEAPVVVAARDDRCRVIGVLQLWLPNWDNTHVGAIELTVDPHLRRRGIGRLLFEEGVRRIRDAGRKLVLADSTDKPESMAFVKAMGLEQASKYVHRRQNLDAIDWARLDREHDAAMPFADGYKLIRLAGPVPEEMIVEYSELCQSINDAPIDDLDIEDEVFPPERIRAFETTQAACNRRTYQIIARHRERGPLAGHTMVGVESEQPWHAWQLDTSVLREHRGHRLGLLLKIEMLRYLEQEEPQVRTLDTGNAASNNHMIQLNELLGYDVLDSGYEWQLHL